MKGIRLRMFTAAAVAITLLQVGIQKSDAAIVNISALDGTGTDVVLGPGTYTVSYAGTAGGGAYDGWNPWGSSIVTGCNASGGSCSQGWTNPFAIRSAALPHGGSAYGIVGGALFETASLAISSYIAALASGGLSSAFLDTDITNAANYSPVTAPITFTLLASTTVNFYIVDFPYGDNAGGVSLNVTLNSDVAETPIPGALPLFASGLGAFGVFTYRRRKRAV